MTTSRAATGAPGLRRCAFAALLLLTAVPLAAQTDPVGETVFDQVAVVEKEALIEFPDLGRSAERLTGEDLWVTEDGQSRDVVGVFPLPPPGEERFQVEILFDGPLLGEDGARLARAALVESAAALVELGPVGMRFVQERRVRRVEPTRSVERLMQEIQVGALDTVALDHLEKAASAARRAAFEDDAVRNRVRREARSRTRHEIAASLARLGELAVTGCALPPCVLVLVSDGFLNRDAEESLIAPDELGAVFSAYGWTVVSLVLRDAPEKPDRGQIGNPATNFEEWTRQRGGVSVGPSRLGADSRLADLDVTAYDVYILPEFQALREWAQESGGATLVRKHQVLPELRRFGQYHRLRYRSEAGGAPRLVPLEVGFQEESPFLAGQRRRRALGLVRENVAFRVASFARSGWPLAPEVALLRLLEGPTRFLP